MKAMSRSSLEIPNATTGIVFLGTPFRGAGGITSSQLISSILAKEKGIEKQDFDIQPRILNFLNADSEQLISTVEDFSRYCNMDKEYIKCHCFFEERPTPIGLVVDHPNIKASAH
jgi:hypothetical protein